MAPRTTRLERVLERNRDAQLVEHRTGRHTVVRRDQVLADPRDGENLDETLTRWSRGREDARGVARVHLRPDAGVDVAELVSDLRGRPGGGHGTVSPNHLMHGEPGWWAGPWGVPDPAPPLPVPTAPAAARPPAVAVLDTGLAPHPWFDGRDWYLAQRDNGIAEVLDADLDYELDNQAGHGTFVAGIVLQQAPMARLLIRRVLGSDGLCDEFDLVNALQELRAHRDREGDPVDVINLSLGCYTFDDRPTPVVERAVRGFEGEPVFVACAGNDGSDRPFWPAAMDDVLAVAALDADGSDRAAFSNYGPWVDACARGEDVHSSFVVFDGPKPATRGNDPDRFRGFARWSGTSFATPAVAGAIAAASDAQGVPAAEAARELLGPDAARSLDDLGTVVPP